jgi:predicted acylesterase/phospholipase RssA
MGGRFNILCLSGGGYLGLYTISVLAALEESSDGPIANHFDLIAGTSVGAIIALGLAAHVPAAKIKSVFERNGPKIFSDRPSPGGALQSLVDIGRSALRPKYRADVLRSTIVELVGADARIGDLQHRLMVPVVNLTKGRPQIFKTPHHPNFRLDLKLRLVDVALAASAAPTYFPIGAVEDSLYVDGGLYANSPDMLALHEAEHYLGIPATEIHLLSVGTTTALYSFAHASTQNPGLVHWLRGQRLVSVFLAAQQQSVAAMTQHKLAERYLRLDADQSKEQERHLALDVATPQAQRTIRGLAQGTIQNHINDPRLRAFLQHVASPPVFDHSLA